MPQAAKFKRCYVNDGRVEMEAQYTRGGRGGWAYDRFDPVSLVLLLKLWVGGKGEERRWLICIQYFRPKRDCTPGRENRSDL